MWTMSLTGSSWQLEHPISLIAMIDRRDPTSGAQIMKTNKRNRRLTRDEKKAHKRLRRRRKDTRRIVNALGFTL